MKCANIKCNYCNRIFKNKKSMSNHRRWHNLPKFKNFQTNWIQQVSFFNRNDKNGMWVGDNIGYDGLHSWIRRRKYKPQFCENCMKNQAYDLANISQEYKRDINDFEWLCRKCHMKKDGRLKNLIQFNGSDKNSMRKLR